jgi:hypothetical protein
MYYYHAGLGVLLETRATGWPAGGVAVGALGGAAFLTAAPTPPVNQVAYQVSAFYDIS